VGRGEEEGGGRWKGKGREVDFIVFPCQGGEDKYPRNPGGGKEILHSQGIWNNELQTEPDFNKSRRAERKGVAKIIQPFKIKKECHGQKDKINNGGKEGRE
jgi:hypothetical protein